MYLILFLSFSVFSFYLFTSSVSLLKSLCLPSDLGLALTLCAAQGCSLFLLSDSCFIPMLSKIYSLFICWLRGIFFRAFPVVVSVGYSFLWCTGFSLQRRLLLQSTGSRARAPWLQLLGLVAGGMWNLPRWGIVPMSPTLTGGSFTTRPPEKFPHRVLY